MAYAPKNLSALAYANGFTLWHYKTADPALQVDTTGYFNGAATMLRAGDFIMANTNTGGTVQSGMFIVRSNTARPMLLNTRKRPSAVQSSTFKRSVVSSCVSSLPVAKSLTKGAIAPPPCDE